MDQYGYLCSIYIFSSNSQEIFHRSYLKIQFVIANIGALSEVFMHLLRAFCYIFTLVKKDKHILNKIFDFDLNKKVPQMIEGSKNIILKSKTMNDLFASKISICKIKQNPSVIKDYDTLSIQKSMIKNYTNFNNSSNNVENSNMQFNLNNKANEKESRIQQKGVRSILNFISNENKNQTLNFTYFETFKKIEYRTMS